jgi:mRNA-degrading endonuclease toxin of MazEF toxin-antitoxin module
VTTTFRDLPNWVPINPNAGNLKPSWVLPDQIRTVDMSRLKGPAGRVDSATMTAIDDVPRLVLDL